MRIHPVAFRKSSNDQNGYWPLAQSIPSAFNWPRVVANSLNTLIERRNFGQDEQDSQNYWKDRFFDGMYRTGRVVENGVFDRINRMFRMQKAQRNKGTILFILLILSKFSEHRSSCQSC